MTQSTRVYHNLIIILLLITAVDNNDLCTVCIYLLMATAKNIFQSSGAKKRVEEVKNNMFSS